jgi:hypothetical protein
LPVPAAPIWITPASPLAIYGGIKITIRKNSASLATLTPKVDILKDLTAKTSFGIDYNVYNFRNYTIRDIESAKARGSNSLQTTNNYEWTWTWYNTLAFTLNLGERHRFNFLIGTE